MGDDVTYALRAFAARFGNARFRRVTVTGVDAARRRVRTDADDEIGYDYLLLCCGVTANYFGIPGAAEHARTVYTRADAIEVRDALLGNLEAYAQGRPEALEPVTVIVGAGATGVEMAGTLAPRSAGCSPGSRPRRWSTGTRGPWPPSGAAPPWPSCPWGVKLTGRVAWVGWLGLHNAMLVGYRNRLATLANLSVRYLAWPGRLNVIVGDPP
jgi:NADH dehydrogenase FAD-containing subunit